MQHSPNRAVRLRAAAIRGLLVTSALCPLVAGAAQAQDRSATALDEIVVTAQRRSENLQNVPIAVTAINAASAAKLGIIDMQSVVEVVPGLTFNRASTGATPFIHGVGSNSTSPGNEPSVATFIDDVYQPTSFGGFFEFNNIEQVEVLKGPQGTLFGRNATGGVIHIHTRDPSFTPSIDVGASYGNYDTKSGQFYGTTKVTENVAANLALFVKDQSDGWGVNVLTGNPTFKSYAHGVRGKVLFQPSDATTVRLSANYELLKGAEGLAQRLPIGFTGRNGYGPNIGFYDASSAPDSLYKNIVKAGSAKITHDFGAAKLVSITGYTDIASWDIFDTDVTPTNFFAAEILQTAKTFTQEVQIVSPDESDLKWIIGAFYMRDHSQFQNVYSGLAFGAAGRTTANVNQKTASYSGFAQMSYEFLPATTMTLGFRLTSDRRNYYGVSAVGAGANVPASLKRTYSSPSGRVSIDHKFTPEVMGYVAYNRGFKSGVFNLAGQGAGSAVAPAPAEPENLNAYTAGFKTEWFDHTLRINAEAFYYDYKNIQVQTSITGASILSNAGAAKIKGIDIDMLAQPIKGLTLSASATIMDGHYTSFPGGPIFFPQAPNARAPFPPAGGCLGALANGVYPVAAAGTPTVQGACDLSGLDTVNTPKFSSNVSASYRFMAGAVPIDASISWARGGNYFYEPDNAQLSKQPRTDIINSSVMISSPDERYTVQLWVKNLGKEKYYSYAQQSGTPGAKFSPAPPRTYGITVKAHIE